MQEHHSASQEFRLKILTYLRVFDAVFCLFGSVILKINAQLMALQFVVNRGEENARQRSVKRAHVSHLSVSSGRRIAPLTATPITGLTASGGQVKSLEIAA